MSLNRKTSLLLLAAATLVLVGCRRDMQDQPRLKPGREAPIFADGKANQEPPAGTVARGLLKDDTHYWQGRDAAGQLVATLPAKFTVDRDLLLRGRERFDIYCSPCHDSTPSTRAFENLGSTLKK